MIESNLKLLEVLLSPWDFKFIDSLKKSNSITREELCTTGDIIISSMRNFGRHYDEKK